MGVTKIIANQAKLIAAERLYPPTTQEVFIHVQYAVHQLIGMKELKLQV